jgi:hypothetical protein
MDSPKSKKPVKKQHLLFTQEFEENLMYYSLLKKVVSKEQGKQNFIAREVVKE